MSDEIARLVAAVRDAFDRLGGGAECRYCPFCQLIAYLRDHPDLLGGFGERPAGEPVQHIDIE